MPNLILFFHLCAAIFWMGGMAFMAIALRGPVSEQLQPPVRLPLLTAVLKRFFTVVLISIAVLLTTGMYLLLSSGMRGVPPGWHVMAGLGILMMLVFAHIWFSPWRRMKAAVAAANWPEAGKRMGQITLLAKVNLAIGWLAIGAVMLWR